jgi:ketosteroid isomerase-like protein
MSLATFEIGEVEEFTHLFESLFNEGNAESMASYYAEDARLLAEDTEPILGRGAIEQFWRAACTGARAATVRRTINLE